MRAGLGYAYQPRGFRVQAVVNTFDGETIVGYDLPQLTAARGVLSSQLR